MSTNEMSPALENAFQLFQQGDLIGAENVLIQSVADAGANFGQTSSEFAQANYELGSLLTLMGRNADAATAFRRACAVNIPDDTQATRDRLTYMMQLGELYNQMGELDEAEQILRAGLKLREDFYGKQHAGYGFGLEPLAAVMMNQGRLQRALEMIEETIDNFWMNGHPRVATAFPLRAMILQKLQDERPPFDHFDDLPDEILIEMVDGAIEIADPTDAVTSQEMLHDLLPLIQRRLGSQHDATIKLQTELANISLSVGQSEGRIETLEKVIAANLSKGKDNAAVAAMLALAMAESETGNPQACEQTYRRAVAKAKDMGDDALQSQCLRNLGLFYSESDRKPDAEQTLRMAAQAGKRSEDPEMYGRSLVALGIFLQHQGQLEDAGNYLSEALKLLDPSHPDSVCGRSHLTALETNQSCGCGDISGALCEAFRQHLLQAIPEGFVSDVDVEIGDEGFEVSLGYARDLNDEESDLLQRTLQQSQIDFRKRLKDTD